MKVIELRPRGGAANPSGAVRHQTVKCPDCGGDAVRTVYEVSGPVTLIGGAANDFVSCARCEARRRGVREVRSPGGAPRSAAGERARDLARELEQLAADAADPALPKKQRAAALELLEGALPPSSPVLERLRQARINRAAANRRTAAKPESKRKRVAEDDRKRAAIRRVDVDENGRRRSDAEVKRLLEGQSIVASPRKIRELRKKD